MPGNTNNTFGHPNTSHTPPPIRKQIYNGRTPRRSVKNTWETITSGVECPTHQLCDPLRQPTDRLGQYGATGGCYGSEFGDWRGDGRLRELAQECGASYIVADLTNQGDVDALREQLEAAGPVHCVVNNAGGAKGLDSVETSLIEDWQWMFEVNVLALKRVTSALLPLLRRGALERGVADIVNITSIAGLSTYPGAGGYCAAKFAAHAVTEVLRLELHGEPIRVIEVAPGMVKTEEFSLVRFGGDQSRADAVYDNILNPLTAADVGSIVVDAVGKPPHVDLDLIVVKPVAQASVQRLHRGPLAVREVVARQ